MSETLGRSLWLTTLTNLRRELSIEAVIVPVERNQQGAKEKEMFGSLARRVVPAVLTLLVTSGSTASAVPANRFGMEHAVLRGVRIEMKDGRKLAGYVGWTSEGFKYEKEKEPKFPESLLDPSAWVEETKALELYTRLYPVSKRVLRRAFPDGDVGMGMVIAIASGTLVLPIKQIARIIAFRMKYDGIEATIDGMITDIHSPSIIRLLINGKPFAAFNNDDGRVLVSFSREIGRRQLTAIDLALTRLSARYGDNFDKIWEQAVRRLQRRGVVVIPYIAVD